MGLDEPYPAARLSAARRATAAPPLNPGPGVAAAGPAGTVEPGIPLAGRHRARAEDIVVHTTDGGQRLTTTPTELIAL